MYCEMKYNEAKIEECRMWVEENGLIEHGGATLKSFCQAMDIDSETFYRWQRQYADFADTIKKAQEVYKDKLTKDAVSSLRKLVSGYTAEEVKTEFINKDGEPSISKQTKTEKHIAPNLGAVIFTLTNIDGEHWKNKQNTDITTDGEKLDVKFEIVKNGKGE